MKVYILFYGWEDVEGVFSTIARACAHRHNLMLKEPQRNFDNFSINEHTVDAP